MWPRAQPAQDHHSAGAMSGRRAASPQGAELPRVCAALLGQRCPGCRAKKVAPSNTQLRPALLQPSLLGIQGNQEHLGLFLFHPLHRDFPAISSGTKSGHISFWEVSMSSRDICAPRKHKLQLPSLWQCLQGQTTAGH